MDILNSQIMIAIVMSLFALSFIICLASFAFQEMGMDKAGQYCWACIFILMVVAVSIYSIAAISSVFYN